MLITIGSGLFEEKSVIALVIAINTIIIILIIRMTTQNRRNFPIQYIIYIIIINIPYPGIKKHKKRIIESKELNPPIWIIAINIKTINPRKLNQI